MTMTHGQRSEPENSGPDARPPPPAQIAAPAAQGVSGAPNSARRAELEQDITHLMEVVPSVIKLLKDRVHAAEAEAPETSAIGDLSLSQVKALAALDRGECVMSDLARRFNVSGPTMTGIVDGLVQRGYVERKRDRADRRCVYLTLTDAGAEVRRISRQRYMVALREFLRPLSDEQLETVVLAGHYLGALLRQEGGAPLPRAEAAPAAD
jgi:DNA-binding MarR family transcriptional regulator